VSEEDLVHALSNLPGVVALTAGPANGGPEVAWGDSFFYYEPDTGVPPAKGQPFATIVVKDYPGFDEASELDRPGVFRLNLAVGRAKLQELFGSAPAEVDYTVLDRVIPHPVYAKQGWVSILVPGEQTKDELPALITHTYQRAKDRYRQ
jgi:hypothetical protein